MNSTNTSAIEKILIKFTRYTIFLFH